LLALLIAFSRLYLGVHYPQDVIGGLVLGAGYLALWLWVEPHVRSRLSRLRLELRYALAILIPSLVLALMPTEDTAAAMGGAAGMGVGYLLDGHTTRFSAQGTPVNRLLRGVLGLAIVVVAYLALRALSGLVPIEGAAGLAWRALQYALLGFVGGWAAPWIFVRSCLAAREEERDE
jgi:undecaprenyl-diphosphatase